jgi:hypothetical protein
VFFNLTILNINGNSSNNKEKINGIFKVAMLQPKINDFKICGIFVEKRYAHTDKKKMKFK